MTARALMIAAVVTGALAGEAAADSDLAPGSFVRQTKHWNSDTAAFGPGAAKGEGEACWQVIGVSKVAVKLKHVGGHYHPWWSDAPIEPGLTDEWFDSGAFREKNPDAPPLTQIRTIFETVASCQELS